LLILVPLPGSLHRSVEVSLLGNRPSLLPLFDLKLRLQTDDRLAVSPNEAVFLEPVVS